MVGNITWENITLNGIGSNLHIKLADGIYTVRKISVDFSFFKSKEDKAKRLSNMKKNQSHYMTVVILNDSNKNIIHTFDMEKKVVGILSGLLKDIN